MDLKIRHSSVVREREGGQEAIKKRTKFIGHSFLLWFTRNGHVGSQTRILLFYFAESGGSVPPRYHERVSPAPVREGETAVLTCTSQGYPPPQYTWFKVHPTNGHLEPVATTEKKHIREGVLIMQNAGLSDSGRYVCVANNSLGSERVELQLTVLVPISVHLTPQRVSEDLPLVVTINKTN